MKFTTAAVAASAAALVSASPINTGISTGSVFRIDALHSDTGIQYGSIQAANGAFYVNTPKQNASCSEDVNYASFRLTDAGELYLNTANPPQEAYVDRSGMGQGIFRYTTGAEGAGSHSERSVFNLDNDNNLAFKTVGFQACPNARQGGYSVWLNINENPGGNSNCIGLIARAVKEDSPISCAYTSA